MSATQLLDVYMEKESNGGQEKRLFICTLCPYRTDRRNNLKRHTSTMHEQSSAVLECCGARFANKAALRHHTAAFHRNGYICSICGRIFCRRALLRRHHAVHSGFKEFSCNLCDYATSHKSNLERHMKIHEGEDRHFSAALKTPSKHNDNASTDNYSEDDDDGHDRLSLSPTTIARDHNPILASLLSQPSSHDDLVQWNYRNTPFDYSSRPALLNGGIVGVASSNPSSSSSSVASGSTPSPTSPPPLMRTDLTESLRRWSFEEQRRRQETVSKIRENSLPLRHAIDVILGVKDRKEIDRSPTPDFQRHLIEEPVDVVTSSPNHWVIGHVTSVIRNDPLAMDLRLLYSQSSSALPSNDVHLDSGVDSDRSSSGSKRRWQDDSDDHSIKLESCDPHASRSPEGDRQISFSSEAGSPDPASTYIPKKLRMSKRYQ